MAVTAVHYLALESKRLQRFLDLTGSSADVLRRSLSDAAFLAGVLEYLLGEERLVLDFAAGAKLPPAAVAQAHRLLAGGHVEEFG